MSDKLNRYFKRYEFACKGCRDKRSCPYGNRAGGEDTVDDRLIAKLTSIRRKWNKPLIITSGHRCFDYNRRIGSTDRSEHPRGRAADFHIPGVPLAEIHHWLRNWKGGLGIYNTFIHIDSRTAHGKAAKARWDKRS